VQVYAATNDAAATARILAVDAATGPALDLSAPCSIGGTMHAVGRYSQPPNDPDHATYVVMTTFDRCESVSPGGASAADTTVVDGTVWSRQEVFDAGVSTDLSGSVEVTTSRWTWNCSLDVQSTIDTTLHCAGTVCDFSAHDDLHLGS
jgi:hypothetical protein